VPLAAMSDVAREEAGLAREASCAAAEEGASA
jgi:hypothetical protein